MLVVLIGWMGDIQPSVGCQAPGWVWWVRVSHGLMVGQKCRSSGGWWVDCSWWWRGMADLPGVLAELGVALTVVPSLGRGKRRKWPNLVVIWQLGEGEKAGF